MSKSSTVYRIVNLATGDFYIGATTQTLDRRFFQHVATALSSRGRKTGLLHLSMRKYGAPSFAIEPMSFHALPADAFKEEARLVRELKPALNTMAGGVGREVMCLDDELIHASASAAGKFYGIAKSMIIEVCLRDPRRVTAGGRVFRYCDDVFDIPTELATAKERRRTRGVRSTQKSVRPVKCLNDGAVYPSAKEASVVYDIHRYSINEVARGDRPHAKGYRFTYDLDEVE
jgi:hypothetical protein